MKKLSNLNDFITNLFAELVPFRIEHCVDSDTPWLDAPVGHAVVERGIAYDHYA
jgi:hypothetical protein